MQRKILAICAALVALGAFAIVPAMASAATLKDTNAKGETEPVALNSKIIATSTGTSVFSGGLTVECNENIMTGEVDKNNGTEAQITITHAYFQSNFTTEGTKCKSGSGPVTVTIPGLTSGGGTKHWCLRNVPAKDEWELWGNNCTTEVGSGELTFILDLAGVECAYKRTTVVKGTYTTSAAEHLAATLTMTNDKNEKGEDEGFVTFSKESGGILCPTTGRLSNMVFDVYTDTEATVENKHLTYPFKAQSDPIFVTNP